MSVNISIQHALKKFEDNVVIPDLSLEVEEGEFFTLLGPSGCGKTTLLRMIAGFNSIEGGEFFFGNTKINHLDPAKRNIGMVFQSYAIFPHLNVRKNVEFGLKNKNVPREERDMQVEKFLNLVHIEKYADRKPEMLSGGQQQRVALARALVISPDVLLMDEPLSNLDAKLRVEMREVIKSIQKQIGITTVYVTHDQEEAMAVSDRIAVINNGIIQHIGAPKSIYQRPANQFVATFIGRSNILMGRLAMEDGKSFVRFKNGYQVEMDNVAASYRRDQSIVVSARPEELILSRDAEMQGIRATVKDSIFLGLNTHYFVELETGENVEIIQESSIQTIIEPGSKISLVVNREKINLFTEDGGRNILTGVMDDNAEPKIAVAIP